MNVKNWRERVRQERRHYMLVSAVLHTPGEELIFGGMFYSCDVCGTLADVQIDATRGLRALDSRPKEFVSTPAKLRTRVCSVAPGNCKMIGYRVS